MSFSADDISKLKELRTFLSKSFKGASIGSLRIDEGIASLDKAIRHCEDAEIHETWRNVTAAAAAYTGMLGSGNTEAIARRLKELEEAVDWPGFYRYLKQAGKDAKARGEA